MTELTPERRMGCSFPMRYLIWLVILAGTPCVAGPPARKHAHRRPGVQGYNTDRLSHALLAAAEPLIRKRAKEFSHPVGASRISGGTGDGQPEAWINNGRQEIVPGSTTYDIERTNSIVSQYVGLVSFKFRMFTVPEDHPTFASKEEALHAPLSSVASLESTLIFAYQRGRWVFKGYKQYHS